MLSEERKAVRQKRGITPAHPLNPDGRRSKARRGCLDPHTAHFVQQHADVTGPHCNFLSDLILRHDLDVKRRVLHTNIVSRSMDRYFFLMLCRRLQLELELPFVRCIDIEGFARRKETIFHDGDIDVPQLGCQHRDAIRPGSDLFAVSRHLRIRYGNRFTAHFDADCRLGRLRKRRCSEDEKNREFTPHVLNRAYRL